ncbi:hypothetical protein Taro_040594 [Colocasia esculenta]|uniref:Uncharacterized protein n=1 Tax=Colocasia esculenta TaxID=4460 RepID=A0A843WYQ9_COLES|nr:hypothetical protein [Colocasia esculenta]
MAGSEFFKDPWGAFAESHPGAAPGCISTAVVPVVEGQGFDLGHCKVGVALAMMIFTFSPSGRYLGTLVAICLHLSAYEAKSSSDFIFSAMRSVREYSGPTLSWNCSRNLAFTTAKFWRQGLAVDLELASSDMDFVGRLWYAWRCLIELETRRFGVIRAETSRGSVLWHLGNVLEREWPSRRFVRRLEMLRHLSRRSLCHRTHTVVLFCRRHLLLR